MDKGCMSPASASGVYQQDLGISVCEVAETVGPNRLPTTSEESCIFVPLSLFERRKPARSTVPRSQTSYMSGQYCLRQIRFPKQNHGSRQEFWSLIDNDLQVHSATASSSLVLTKKRTFNRNCRFLQILKIGSPIYLFCWKLFIRSSNEKLWWHAFLWKI